MRTVRLALSGLGNVGRRFVALLAERSDQLRAWGLDLRLVAVGNSSGAWRDDAGLDLALVQERAITRPHFDPGHVLDGPCDLYLDATTTSFTDGSIVTPVLRALGRGAGCVLATKGPLVQAFGALAQASDWTDPTKPGLRFGAAVGSAVPSVNVGRREYAGARITRLEGVLNITCQRALALMSAGRSMPEAVRELQAAGSAEQDPRMDVEGWDSAAKLLILASALMGVRTGLAAVERRGIEAVTAGDVEAARTRGERLVLLASAAPWEGGVRLSVAPASLGPEHPLARISAAEQGLVIESDLHGTLTLLGRSLGPRGTAAAMLRDVLELAQERA
jgi:homoserine dehydrogenase